MTHGSLFSGIGGFDIAAEWMGWENVFHCEWNPFGQKVLKYYWPDAISYNDITKTDFTIHRGRVDIITGGFPCQPYSMAGKRLGKEDDRHLWPEMLRAIREIQPRWVVGENVFGLVNWADGLVFHEVQANLEAEGYEVQSYVLPAAGVQNAPHRRDRVWFVAYAKSQRQKSQQNWAEKFLPSQGQILHGRSGNGHGKPCTSADSDIDRLQRSVFPGWDDKQGRNRQVESIKEHIHTHGKSRIQNAGWQNFPTVSPICDGDDGISDRLDGVTFSKWREESIKAGGNAVVPQVVLSIFRTIEEYEKMYTQ